MKKMENLKVDTAEDIINAEKDGYKYAVQMSDSSDIYVSEELNKDDLIEIYSIYGYEYNEFQNASSDRHMGCPIDEAIEWFKL